MFSVMWFSHFVCGVADAIMPSSARGFGCSVLLLASVLPLKATEAFLFFLVWARA